MDEQLSVKLISALANAWNAIRGRHPDVPGVVILAAPAQRGRINVLGHFAPLRWSARKETENFAHEVVVVAEHLNRSAEDVFETILHESAHALNCNRGIKDCTASQYHNGKFRDAAHELGLVATKIQHYGWASTRLPAETAEIYKEEIEELERALLHRRSRTRSNGASTPQGGDNDKNTGSTDEGTQGRNRKAVCACEFIIRVSRQTLRDTIIVCKSCEEPFRIV